MRKLNSIIASTVNRGLSFFGVQIKRADSGFWDSDREFLCAYDDIRDRTLVKIDRSYMLYQFAKSSAMLPVGDVAQVGIYKGGTAKMIARCFANSGKKIYLFDTFEGLPSVSEEDGENVRKNNVTKAFADVDFGEIKNYFSGLPNVEFRKGFFPNTAIGLNNEKFCFVYLDADLYQSTKDGLSFFYPLMVSGGVIMIDDFGTANWPGVKRAVNEFCSENGIATVKTAWWQGLIIKSQ